MKILFAHVVYKPEVDKWYQEIADAAGDELDVHCFCLTLNPPSNALSWPQLDHLWKSKDKQLMKMYERLQEATADCDVMINYNGYNLHPEFLHYLSTFNVFCCFDDPESSQNASAPVAAYYDAAFYGNIASRFQYESWGCKRLAWLPIFTAPSDVPPKEEESQLFTGKRNVDIVFIGEKNHRKKNRLDMLSQAFPQAKCYGKGWKCDFINNNALNQLYRDAKIGWNIHNSTGPINRRLFILAGYGILPICDNKTGLGQIFELGKSAVGFDTVPEAIEATGYYLVHDDERCEIAYNAYQRFWQDYHAKAIWQRIYRQLNEWVVENHTTDALYISSHPQKTIHDRIQSRVNAIRHTAKGFVRWVQSLSDISSGKENDAIHNHLIDERVYLGEKVIAYQENPEMRGVNMAQERLASGNPLDWPNILALNWAVTSLIGKARRIIEIGSGTGPFAEYASIDGERSIDCFEENDFARNKAMELRPRRNVNYYKTYTSNLKKNYDLLVSIEVIEHVFEIDSFLSYCNKLAPRAIFSTPNRLFVSEPQRPGPPNYLPHVREFSPGEIYWILRLYYKSVFLYYMPDVYVPWLEAMTLATQGTPIIAECIDPIHSTRKL